MKFIHKNVNTALLLLIAFISLALVTGTVYSVQAFDKLHTQYAEKAIEAEELTLALHEKEQMASQLRETADLKTLREAKLSELLAKERQENESQPAPQTQTVQQIPQSRTGYSLPYNSPYRRSLYPYGGVRYVI